MTWLRAGGLLAVLLAILAAPAAAQIEVEILSPASGQPLFGQVEVVARVSAEEPLHHVDILVDGRLAAHLLHSPYRTLVDVGQQNREHRIRVVATGLFGGSGEASLVAPRIEVDETIDVALLQLYVTVSGPGGKLAQGLQASDFQIVDQSGQARPPTTFARGDLPISAVLLVDSSESMKGARLEAALDGARAFVRGLQGEDEARVLLFSDRLLRATPFTRDPDELSAPLEGAQASGGTALNDALYVALNLLDRRLGRPVVVMLSDGADVTSLLSMHDLLWKVHRSQAILYWVRLLEPGESAGDTPLFASAWRTYEENRQELELLRRAITDSGGRTLPIRSVGDLGTAFGKVLEELRGQYILGYSPRHRKHDGSWQPLEVRVEGKGLTVRTRTGYVDD